MNNWIFRNIDIQGLDKDATSDDRQVCVIKREGRCEIGQVRLEDMQEGVGNKYSVKIWMEAMEYPEKMTAMYMLNDWWTRPAFLNSFSDIPDKTQVLFTKKNNKYACFVPMVGNDFKTYIKRGNYNQICLEMITTMKNLTRVNEIIYVWAQADTMEDAVAHVFNYMAEKKGILLREKRRMPEIFQSLGWCSWDAFYRDITEQKVKEKAREFAQKQIPVKWMLIDDGWMTMDLEKEVLKDYKPDIVKFPNGFQQMIENIKDQTNVDYFGVWHALCGFWKGVKKDSFLYEKKKEVLYHTANDKFIPNPIIGAEQFYRDWYEYLRNEGIDFVKVDGQSSFWDFADGSLPIGPATKGIHQALEAGGAYMDGAIINCMGMAMENILSRPTSAISRNSDDFVPNKENGFAEHLLQNAYNAIYHDAIYYCDWDMFWTKHPDAIKHSLLRAVSGGPVYISDKIGDTNADILRPLIYEDGKLLMMEHSAKPTEDCIFKDPKKEGVLKLYNTGRQGQIRAGGIVVYNLLETSQKYFISPTDIKGVEESNQYVMYEYFTKEYSIVSRDSRIEREIDKNGYAWYILLPYEKFGACLGLIDKYVGFTAVEEIIYGENFISTIVHEGGTIGWICTNEVKEICVNGKTITEQMERKGDLLLIHLPQSNHKQAMTIWF